MTACGPERPQIETQVKTRQVFPETKGISFDCVKEPLPGVVETDVQAAQFAQKVREAGRDCREKLGLVKAWVASWPKDGAP